ncbi:MAG: hypothetical protein ACE5JD_16710, partial [Candidatus Methylomirabilia bacterium]
DLLKAYFQIETRDDARKIREKVTGKLLTLDRALEPMLPAFLSLLDVPVEDPHWQDLDPGQRRQRTLDAVKRLLLRESQVQPLCLVFEDLHWIDSETQAFLDSLVESLPTARVLLLVNYRSEYRHTWGSKTYYTQLRIDPLPPKNTQELLQALMGDDASLAPLKRRLMERTEGNPFFLEESVRTLIDTQVLMGERGAYRLAKPLESIQVPRTVQAVLASRIDQLAPEDKRLLQSASVIGENVTFALLQAVGEMPEEDLRQALSRLQAAELLYETSLFPDLEYTFKHGLTYQVAYDSLLLERRRVLHAKIVDAIERLYADRLAEQAERLAHHALQGEVWDKALRYLRQAGTKAAGRSAHREAVAWFQQALVALQHLPQTRQVLEQAFDLRLDLRNSLAPFGEIERVLEHLHEAETLAQSMNDQQRHGRVLSFLSSCFWVLGNYPRALETAHRTLAMAKDLEDASLLVYATVALSWTYHSVGDYRRGVEFGREAVEFLQGDRLWEHFGVPSLPAVSARTWLALCLAERGEFVEASTHAQEGVRLAETIQEPWSVVAAYLGLGIPRLRKGEVDAAIGVLERGLELCRRFDIRVWLAPLASSLGYAYALAGRLSDAISLLTEAVQQATSTRLQFFHSIAIIWLSETYLLARREEDAARLACDGLKLCQAHQEAGHEAYALRLLAEIGRRATPPNVAQAEAHYGQALTVAGRLEMKPLVAHCHFGLGELSYRTERWRSAQQHLRRAADLFGQMGMASWAERSAAKLKDVDAKA